MTELTLLEAVSMSDTIVTILTPQRNMGIPKEMREKGDYGITNVGGRFAYWMTRNGDRLLPFVKEYLSDNDELKKAFQSLPEVIEIGELTKVDTKEMKPDDKKAHQEKIDKLDKVCQELWATHLEEEKKLNDRLIQVDLFKIDYSLLDTLDYNPTYYPNMNLIMKYLIVNAE